MRVPEDGVTERNLDRAINLASNGRIKPEEVVKLAQELDAHCKSQAER